MQMNRPIFIAPVVLFVSFAMASFSFSATEPDEDAANGPENIGQLLNERVAVLKSRHEHAVSGYNSGVLTFEQVHLARLEYLGARLDACTGGDERIAILKESVDTARAVVPPSTIVSVQDSVEEGRKARKAGLGYPTTMNLLVSCPSCIPKPVPGKQPWGDGGAIGVLERSLRLQEFARGAQI